MVPIKPNYHGDHEIHRDFESLFSVSSVCSVVDFIERSVHSNLQALLLDL
jgi:hypothetical protein